MQKIRNFFSKFNPPQKKEECFTLIGKENGEFIETELSNNHEISPSTKISTNDWELIDENEKIIKEIFEEFKETENYKNSLGLLTKKSQESITDSIIGINGGKYDRKGYINSCERSDSLFKTQIIQCYETQLTFLGNQKIFQGENKKEDKESALESLKSFCDEIFKKREKMLNLSCSASPEQSNTDQSDTLSR